MAWSTIRRATDNDTAALNAAAVRFAARHNLTVHTTALSAVDDAISPGYGEAEWEATSRKRLARLWKACARRALKSAAADGIAYGYVGYHVD